MAMSWASKRKLKFTSIFIGSVIVILGIPSFLIFYKAPTCFDKIMNGGETGIDCGGKCSRLCQSAFLSPRIEWGGAKIEKVADGIYNISSYLVNPNINGGAIDVPFKVSLYDSQGVFIMEKQGLVNMYPHRNSLAFLATVKTEKRIPSKASFEFVNPPEWFKSEDNLIGISIEDKEYRDNENSSILDVTFQNNTLKAYKNVKVSSILYDSSGNVIGFSQTKIDSIEGKKRETASFTWPFSRKGKVASIEIIYTTEPIPVN